MNKNELIKSIGTKVENVSQKDISSVLDALSEVVVDVVKADDDVSIPGIGKVSVKTVPERRGKIMLGDRKGEEYVVPEHKEPKIKLAKGFKEVLLQSDWSVIELNKQEKNIVDIITFDETEDIVDIFIDEVYRTDKTIALITNKYLVEYAMDVLLNDDCITIKRVDLELDSEDTEYMISVDDDGYMVVQPVEYYDDKYFKDIEYAFVDMDGCVDQMTIDNLLDRNVPVVLFGYEDERKCDECECACKKDEKPTTASKESYFINGKSVDKSEFDKKYKEFEEMYLNNIRDMLLNYCEMMDEMNEWRKLFRWQRELNNLIERAYG